MQNTIILHGTCDKSEYYSPVYPSASNFHWLPWLQKQLLIRDVHAVTPEMPHGYAPDYAVWTREFERHDVKEDTILIGHSCGAGFLVRWLTEHPAVQVKMVILVAPWLDPDGIKNNDFFDFEIRGDIASQAEMFVIYHSLDDDAAIHSSVDSIRAKIGQHNYREYTDKGHFTVEGLGTNEFPELLEEIERAIV